MLNAMIVRHCAVLAAAIMLAGCGNGMSACEQATKAMQPPGSEYAEIAVKEEPGETPAMTYYVIDYLVTGSDGTRRHERVHCAYIPDTGEADPHRIASSRAPK